MDDPIPYLKNRLDAENYERLMRIQNPTLHQFLAKYIKLCNPDKIHVLTDSKEDMQFIREEAIRNHEEAPLATPGHTVHFDGYQDQGRDKEGTKFLLPKDKDLGPEINSVERNEGLEEINGILENIMRGHPLYIKFFCLGPLNSKFTIPCVQLTDSAYVIHNKDLLYRQGFQEWIKLGHYRHFLKFIHSEGELEEAGLGLKVSKNIPLRRMYMDLEDEIIYSTNTQYGGNVIGLKKLAMRLAINRASQEGWLTEHMALIGIHGPNSRKSYFAGAYPSMCGKTATAMLEGETMLGDDIAYLRCIDNQVRAVNVEKGIFGIIKDVNSKDDPLVWKALTEGQEVIFSNILVTADNQPHWLGKDGETPAQGINHSGDWTPDKKDANDQEITPSHKNARFTIAMDILNNADSELDNPEGVELSGIIYGGRDSDTSVPVEEAFDWRHGIIMKGAGLESETTAATLGQEGVRSFNPMSNLDFLSIPIGKYIENNLEFGAKTENPPRIFSANYFLRDKNGEFTNHKNDKRVWLKWMELRVNDEVEAIETPTGFIPKYTDLKRLFQDVLNKEYSEADYIQQFTTRIPENFAKIERLRKIYTERVLDTPAVVMKVFAEQEDRLKTAQAKYGDYIAPAQFNSIDRSPGQPIEKQESTAKSATPTKKIEA